MNKDVYEEAIKIGASNLNAHLIANRITDPKMVRSVMHPTSADIPPMRCLLDAKKAARVIYKHIRRGSNIVLCTDSDADGVSSAAILYLSLTRHYDCDPKKVHTIINKRMYGNGFNPTMVSEVKEHHKKKKVDLLILADHGSSDDIRFKEITELGVDIVVTDHHQIPLSGELKNVSVFVNPQREKDNFSRNISGCHVVYLVMSYIQNIINDRGDPEFSFSENALGKILPIMTNTILSDQMNLSDPINRLYLKRGLDELTISTEPIWLALRDIFEVEDKITEDTVSFLIAPLLNAANRIGFPEMAYEFLISDSFDVAVERIRKLKVLNEERKKLEGRMLAIANANLRTCTYDNAVVLVLPEGPGVVGLVAQTIGQNVGKPTVCFIEEDGYMKGSGRGIVKGVDLVGVFNAIKAKDKRMVVKHGGHKMAAGLTIRASKFKEFVKLFDNAMSGLSSRDTEDGTPHDIEASLDYVGDSLFDELSTLGPYGNGYRRPVFKTECVLESYFKLGKIPIHSIVTLTNSDRTVRHKCFYPRSASNSFYEMRNKKVVITYTIGRRRYLGKTVVSPTIITLTSANGK